MPVWVERVWHPSQGSLWTISNFLESNFVSKIWYPLALFWLQVTTNRFKWTHKEVYCPKLSERCVCVCIHTHVWEGIIAGFRHPIIGRLSKSRTYFPSVVAFLWSLLFYVHKIAAAGPDLTFYCQREKRPSLSSSQTTPVKPPSVLVGVTCGQYLHHDYS